MGHARCEKLMGFNMELASVRRSRGAVILDAAHGELLSGEMEIYRVWETITQTFHTDRLTVVNLLRDKKVNLSP
jgi:hypothetical protein